MSNQIVATLTFRSLYRLQRYGLLLLWISLLGGLWTVRAQPQDLGEPDLSAMNALRDNYGWGAAFGWPNTNPCPKVGANWSGVSCSQVNGQSRVDSIVASCGATKLTTALPAELGILTAMRDFNLRGCYVNPAQPVAATAVLDSLTRLTRVRLDDNPALTGTINDLFPSGIGPTARPNLTTFFVFGTNLSGSISTGLFQFSGNAQIRLNQARFSGTLPATGNPAINIHLHGNALEGVLPSYIVNATSPGDGLKVSYNKFDVVNTPAGNVDNLDPGWRNTQTVPPTNVQATPNGAGAATLSWTPIGYQQHGGYYEVLSSRTAGGPYTSRGTTASAGGKTASSLTVTGLPGGTNYFVVRTFTSAHMSEVLNCRGGMLSLYSCQLVEGQGTVYTSNNPNDLTSVNSAEVSLEVQNATPTILGATISQPIGSPAATAQIATVGHAEQAANTLNVSGTLLSGSGVTLSNISVDVNGNVTADVQAACGATNSAFTLTVTDNGNAFATAQLLVNVSANPAPTLTYPSNPGTVYGTGITVNPLTRPSDNGRVNSVQVFSVVPAVSGGITVDSAGVVTVVATVPAGNYIVTIHATDDCGAITEAHFSLGIVRAPLTVTVNNAWRNQGAANPPFSGSITGLQNGDNITASYSTTATTSSVPGAYPIMASLIDPNNRLGNYQVTNNSGTLTILNSCGITVNPATLPTATLGKPFAQTLSASPTGSYSFSLLAGTLPPGLQIVNVLGIYSLRGTPTMAGVYTFLIKARKNNSTCESARTYTIVIAPS